MTQISPPPEGLERRDVEERRQQVIALSPAEAADELERLHPQQRAAVFRLLPKDTALAVFEQIDTDAQQELLEGLHDHQVIALVEGLTPDDRARLLDEMPAAVAKRLLQNLNPQEREATTNLLGYPPDSAGRVMTPEYVRLAADMSVEEALAKVRRVGPDSETIYKLYVTDDSRHLQGVVTLKDLILAPPGKRVDDLAVQDTPWVITDTDQEEVARIIQQADLLAVPVVDREMRLVGIVTVDDVIDIIQREASEDILKGGAVGGAVIDYGRARVRTLWARRIGWLLALQATNFLTLSIIASYEVALEAVVALAFFIPMLIGTGGNTGTQASTLVIRALATDSIRMSDWLRVLWKEVRVGLLLGVTLGLIVAALGYIRAGGPELGLVVGLTIVAIVLWANLLGAILPFIIKRLGADPAVVSSPMIATLVDVTGLLIYFTIATVVLLRAPA